MISIKKCKTCYKDITYKSRPSYRRAVRNNSDCKKCSALKRKPKTDEHKRKISLSLMGKKLSKTSIEKRTKTFKERYSNNIEYKQKLSFLHKGEKNGMFGKHHNKETRKKISEETKMKMWIPEIRKKVIDAQNSKEYKEKLSKVLKGRVFSEETKMKMRGSREFISGKNNPNFGKHRKHTIEDKKKMRLATINRIRQLCELGCKIVFPFYNPNACKIIDEYGKQNNYNFQHALNGGEYHIEELGYWVDGYDKEKNVVLEIDEKHHFDSKGELKQKDKNRQKEIEKFLKCKFIRIPFNKNP